MTARTASVDANTTQLPMGALLALAMAGFLALLTETIPAGMLTQISTGLDISPTLSGQFVTLYALGSLIAAMPLTAATQGWRRRPLLIVALIAILLFNALTAISSNYLLSLASRFLAGMAGGLIWGMLAGYARRMVPASLKGRALAVTGLGVPLALSLGVPIGSLLGSVIGWRFAFGVISLVTLAVIAWIIAAVPDFPGQPARQRLPIRQVWTTPGVRPVLVVLACWMTSHSILYTYVMPLLEPSGLAERADLILFIFGLSTLVGIWIMGTFVDRMLRKLVLMSLVAFALAALALGLAIVEPVVVCLAIAVWGATFGGSATLLQTASADAAGAGADVAQSIFTTVWNIAIALGGMIGGVILEVSGPAVFGWVAFVLIAAGFAVAGQAGKSGFR